MSRLSLTAPLAVVLLVAVGCAAQPEHMHAASKCRRMRRSSAAPGGPPPLWKNLGTYSHPITTSSPQSQAYFDQGLRLTYGFNHGEAQRSFREAARVDPVVRHVPVGHRHHLRLELQRPHQSGPRAGRARGGAEGAGPRGERPRRAERAIIDALVKRHQPGGERAALDRAYADAMRDVAQRFPDDLEAAHLLRRRHDEPPPVESLDSRRPAAAGDGGDPPRARGRAGQEPEPSRARSTSISTRWRRVRTRAARAAPPTACGASCPAPATWCTCRRTSTCGWGATTSRWTCNVRAAEADRAYFKEGMPSPIYRGMYYPHNLDFIWHAASMDGRSAETLKAARDFAGEAPLEMVRQMSDMETAPVAPIFALARFGRWEEILREPAPPADLPYWRGAWHYARGLAFAATGRAAEAQRELAALQAVRDGVPADAHAGRLLQDARDADARVEVLSGELAARARRTATRPCATSRRPRASRTATGSPSRRPGISPCASPSARCCCPRGRPAEAEAVYREDLRRNPENGWSLFGLAQALRAQGKADEAVTTDARYRRAWARSDVTLTSSRF